MNKIKKSLYGKVELPEKFFDGGFAIFKLVDMLKQANIPYEFSTGKLFSGWQVVIKLPNEECIDVIQNPLSYGWTENLLEIYGGLTEEENKIDAVLGWLTAEEVFERFKYCYENNTTVYKKS